MTGTSIQILGASCAVPNTDRATSGYLIRGGGRTVLLECGHGVVGKLRRYASPEDLDAIVITHMHPDHFIDLIALRNYIYVHGLDRLPLHTPATGPGVLRGVATGMNLAPGYFDTTFDVRVYGPDEHVRIGGLVIDALQSRHNTLAYSLRITDPDGYRLVFSSDTGWYEGFAAFADRADVLLLEATDPQTPDTDERWHLCPRDAAAIVNAARPGVTLLTHYLEAHAAQIRDEVADACPDLAVHLAVEGETHRVGS